MSQEQSAPALIDTSRAPVPGTTTTTMVSSPGGKASREQEGLQINNRTAVPQLPRTYGRDRLVILVRDPRWLFAYWELTARSWEQARAATAASDWDQGRTLLRLLATDVTSARAANQTGSAERQPIWQAEVGMADNWYIELPDGVVSYASLYAELGRSLPGGEFIPLLQSNIAFLPPHDVSPIQDADWLTIEEVWQRFVGLPPGTSSEAFIRALRARYAREAFSPGISAPLLMSPGVSPGFSPGAWQGGPGAVGQFWLTVSTDLILYGATEPGASVTIGGQPVAVAADGSFRVQFHLVDGELVLPVAARQPLTGRTCETIIRIRRETAT